MALITFLDKVITAMGKGESTFGLFLDFSKAFDTVNHSILPSTLNHYGMRGVANNWTSSYLYQRQQYVTYNDTRSEEKTVTCGVPQDSVLGPLRFYFFY